MATDKNIEKVYNFICKECDFKCCNKTDWERHIIRPKHQKNVFGNDLATKKHKKTYNCDCGKFYSDRTGLWKHKQKCNQTNCDFDMKTLVMEVVKNNNELQKQNQDFKDLLIEQNKTIIEAMKHHSISNVNSIVNSNNKTFNLQVFLNEDCKDAMNISDFMNSIQLQLEELVSVGKLGFVEGISNIIIKNLKALDIRKRPLHCTDLKRETVYIKENGVWIKDDEDNTKLRKVIKNVAFRNSKNTRLFKDKYPDCVRSESRLSDTYSIIIIEAMGGGSKTDPKESEDKILRRILKELTIDKSK